jgi:ABC-type uncharacterized transport system permease subunit
MSDQLSEGTSERLESKIDINRICACMVVLACTLIAVMLITSHFQSSSETPAPAGWVAVVGAAIVFGRSSLQIEECRDLTIHYRFSRNIRFYGRSNEISSDVRA